MTEFPGNYTEGKKPISSTIGFHLYNNAKEKNYKSGKQICCYQPLERGEGMVMGRECQLEGAECMLTKEQYEGAW